MMANMDRFRVLFALAAGLQAPFEIHLAFVPDGVGIGFFQTEVETGLAIGCAVGAGCQ
jgi:hypothetical protein